jgi:hypothetical protein
MQYSENREESK